ncbi:MAG: Coenzyme F420:L-glutamate ligase [Candidatus Woesearchaeota archaeon]|nr:Coenzyme F420:L-glutamate ligase [Candidatus Woesearchaeota archaeon]
MDVLEAIKKRKSIRKYLDVPVEWDKVGKILDAGRLSPSAGNVQDWRFIVVTDPGLRKKIAEASLKQYWMEQAPVFIVVITELEKIRKHYGLRGERLYAIQDCAIAATSMMLAAQSLGLSTCWVGAFEEGMIQELLGMPDNVRPQVILTIGYADEDPEPTYRYPLEHITLLNGYGGNARKIKDFGKVFWDHNIVGRAVESTKKTVKDIEKVTRDKRQEHTSKIKKFFKNLVKKKK